MGNKKKQSWVDGKERWIWKEVKYVQNMYKILKNSKGFKVDWKAGTHEYELCHNNFDKKRKYSHGFWDTGRKEADVLGKVLMVEEVPLWQLQY